MLDKFTSIRVVKTVSELQSFSAAARRLGLSHTMISKHVSFMEHTLGTKLFHRSTRVISPTRECLDYLSMMTDVLDQMQRIEQTVVTNNGRLAGTLRITAPQVLVRPLLRDAICTYRQQFPAMHIEISVCSIINTSLPAEFDLLIQLGGSRESRVSNEHLLPTRGVLCAAPEYIDRHGKPESVADLSRHSCILCAPATPSASQNWMFGTDGDIVVPVHGGFWADDWETIRSAALDGHGLAYVPSFLVEDAISTGDLVELPLEVPMGEYLPICASYRGDTPPRRTAAFLAVLQGQLENGLAGHGAKDQSPATI